MSKHTPGPWRAYLGTGMIGPSVRSADTDQSICTLRLSVRKTREQVEADAILIAAAPKMLDALKKAAMMIKHLNSSYGGEAEADLVNLCIDVIEEAGGFD